jgi:hypothetical protein
MDYIPSDDEVHTIAINLMDFAGNLPLGLLIDENESVDGSRLDIRKIQFQLFAYNIAAIFVAMARISSPAVDRIAQEFTSVIRNHFYIFGCSSESELYAGVDIANRIVVDYFKILISENRDKSYADSIRWGIDYFNSLGIKTHNPISGFLPSHHLATQVKSVSAFLTETIESLNGLPSNPA